MRRLLVAICPVLCLVMQAQAEAPDAILKQAGELQGQGKLDEAIGLLGKAVEEHPESSSAFMLLGQLYGQQSGEAFRANDFNGAMKGVNLAFESLDKSIELDPANVEARLTWGMMGMQVPDFFGRLDPGVRHLEQGKKVIDQWPEGQGAGLKAAVYRHLGEGYKKQDRNAEAVAVWEALLGFQSEGEHAEAAKNGIAELKSTLESADVEAVETMSADLKQLLHTGRKQLASEEFAAARETFEAILGEDENHVEAQLLLIRAISGDATREYDDRIYSDQNTRTHLAFDLMREMERGMVLAPDNIPLKLEFATLAIYMPFFVEKIDKGLAILEALVEDASLPDSTKQHAQYMLGFGYRKKGNAVWANMVKEDQASEAAQQVYDVFGLRETDHAGSAAGDRVEITFHLGFLDELAPQTAIWIENEAGEFVKTIYVSGFAGFAKEKQITLRKWGEATDFETDGATAASIDWGTHTYAWDLTDHAGDKVKNGTYKVRMEVSWWPTYRYALTEASVDVGKKGSSACGKKMPFVPKFSVQYVKK